MVVMKGEGGYNSGDEGSDLIMTMMTFNDDSQCLLSMITLDDDSQCGGGWERACF